MTALKAPRRQTLKFTADALRSATLPPHYYYDPNGNTNSGRGPLSAGQTIAIPD